MANSIRTLEPWAIEAFRAFIRFLEQNGVSVRVTSARRSQDEQARLYAAAKAGKAKYTVAAPGHSTHALGIACDMVLNGIVPSKHPPYPAEYQVAGAVWEALGGTWGGRFSDPVHFDLRRFVGLP